MQNNLSQEKTESQIAGEILVLLNDLQYSKIESILKQVESCVKSRSILNHLFKRNLYPHQDSIGKKIHYILDIAQGEHLTVESIRDKLLAHEPKLNVTNINQYCSMLAKGGKIGIEKGEYKNKYFSIK